MTETPKTPAQPISATTRPAPLLKDYASRDEWEEATSRWHSTVGRNKAIAVQALVAFRQTLKSRDK